MRSLLLLAAFAGLAFAQFENDTVTVLATGDEPRSPEQVSMTLWVRAKLGVTFDQVLKTLAPAGVGELDLTGASAPMPVEECPPPDEASSTCGGGSPGGVSWSFSVRTTAAKLSQTLSGLQRLRDALDPEMTLNFRAMSLPSSVQAPPECSYTTLVGRARRHAADLASAAGLRLGPVVAIVDSQNFPGDFLASFATPGMPLHTTGEARTDYNPACAVVVQFQLLR